jgi:glucokinase
MKTVGIDIGGTKTAFALFEDERLLETHAEPTTSFDETAASIVSWCKRRGADAVGVGCTGPLDEELGIVKNADTLVGWFDAPLVPRLQEALGLEVPLVNDADAALLGELWAGSVCDSRSQPVLMLTFGTGVGGAVWDGDRLLKGAQSQHPEIGHILVRHGGRLCYCGLDGCLEAETSGTALNLEAQEAGYRDFAHLVEIGDPIPVFKRVGAQIDVALRVFAHAYSPAAIILGGGMVERYPNAYVTRSVLTPTDAPLLLAPMRIVCAKLGSEAGFYGAAALAMGVLG